LREIADLGGSRDFYWGILSRDEQRKINLEIKNGTLTFLQLKSQKFTTGRFDYALDVRRSEAIRVLKDDKGKKVLEIGCGYGGITETLAEKFGNVDALDACFELLEFTQLRLESAGISNVNLKFVPIFEEYFQRNLEGNYDLIVINGVLEWIGSGTSQSSPYSHQSNFLKKCESLLSKDGEIFLAIENRWYPKWWVRDPHSKLPMTAILPRKFANRISKSKLNEEYRTWIYSRFGIYNLFYKSNLSVFQELYVLMTYRSPKWISDRSAFRRRRNRELIEIPSVFWNSMIKNGILRRLVFPLILPSFVFILKSKSGSRR